MNKFGLHLFIAKIRLYEKLIASALLLAAILVATVTFLIPNILKVQEIVSEKEQLNERYTVLKRKDAQLTGIDAQMYTGFLTRMKRIVPESKDFVSLFTTFDSLEKKTNVIIAQTDFQFGVVSTNSAQLIKSSLVGAYVVPFRTAVSASVESDSDAATSPSKCFILMTSQCCFW